MKLMQNKKALIFGITGQDGYYLKLKIESLQGTVLGVSRKNENYIIGDVADPLVVNELVQKYRPDYIFHLAANSTTNHDVLYENHHTISTGSLNILESVYRHSRKTKVFLSGSGLQFVNNEKPISEYDAFEARDVYSVARISSVYAARYYRRIGVQAYMGYFFNHDSPLRSERHINQKIVQTVKRIASGAKEIIELGDIDVRKEFTFAGDSVDAILNLVNNDQIFETVIGSGKAYAISDWLELCFRHYKLNWKEYIRIKPGYIAEYKKLVSDPSTLFALGWKPRVDIESLAKMMLEYKQ